MVRMNGIFQNQNVCIIRPSRGQKVIEEVMGNHKPEAWVSDIYNSQTKHPATGNFALSTNYEIANMQLMWVIIAPKKCYELSHKRRMKLKVVEFIILRSLKKLNLNKWSAKSS